jgi:tetratricopeptide (TPR) repeat protein
MLEHEQHIMSVDLLFNDERIGDFIKSIQIDSPYQQMLHEGVLTESVRDEKLYVYFTVEGYFHYVLGEVIENMISDSNPELFFQKLINNKLNSAKNGLEEYLIKCAIYERKKVIYEFIDLYPDDLNLIIKAFASLMLFKDMKSVLNTLFKTFTENDIKLLIEVLDYLYKVVPKAQVDLQASLLNFNFLSQIEIFKKSYLDALNNVPIESVDISLLDNINSHNIDLEFEINTAKIELYRKLNKHKLAEKLIKRNVLILKYLKSNYSTENIKTFYNSISLYYSEIGNYKLAIKASKKALSLSNENHADYGPLLNNLALKYIDLGMFDDAEICLNKALSIDLIRYGKYSRNVSSRYGNFGLLLLEKANYSESIIYLKKALNIDKVLFGNYNEVIATRLINLSEALRNTNQIEEALKCILEARKIDIANYGKTHPMIAYSYNIEAHIHNQLGDLNSTIQAINKAIEINLIFQNGLNDRLNRDYNLLGITYYKFGKLNESLECFLKAEIIEKDIYLDFPHLKIKNWINICKVYCKMRNKQDLKRYLDKINSLSKQIRKEYSDIIEELIII